MQSEETVYTKKTSFKLITTHSQARDKQNLLAAGSLLKTIIIHYEQNAFFVLGKTFLYAKKMLLYKFVYLFRLCLV